MEFTSEQLQAIDAGEAIAISLEERSCVVVRRDAYEKVAAGTTRGLPSETIAALVDQSMAVCDADDPLLEKYQQVD